MAISDQVRRITPEDMLVFDSRGNVIGLRSGRSSGEEGRMLCPDDWDSVRSLVPKGGITEAQAIAGIDLGDEIGSARELTDGDNLGARVRWYQPVGAAAPVWCWDIYPQSVYEG